MAEPLEPSALVILETFVGGLLIGFLCGMLVTCDMVVRRFQRRVDRIQDAARRRERK